MKTVTWLPVCRVQSPAYFAYYKYAKLPFRKLIQPAIDLAEKGFAITAAEAADLNDNQEDFKKYNSSITGICKEFRLEGGRYADSKRSCQNAETNPGSGSQRIL